MRQSSTAERTHTRKAAGLPIDALFEAACILRVHEAPQALAQVVQMRYFASRTAVHIGAALGVSAGAVCSHREQARLFMTAAVTSSLLPA